MGRPRKHHTGLPPRVTKKHRAFYYIDKSQRWIRLADEGDDAGMYEALARILRGETHGMHHLLDLYEERIMPTKAPKTRQDQEHHLEVLRTTFGVRDPDSIEPKDIATFLDTSEHPVAANRVIALLSSVFTYGVRWGLAKHNPCLGVRRNQEHPRSVYVTGPTFWDAWSDAPQHIGLTMELSLVTGQRLADVLGLRWSDVHDEGVYFRQRKTKKAVIITRTEWLNDLLRRCRTYAPDSDHVLNNSRQRRWTVEGFKTAWQRFMRNRDDRFQFRDIRKKSGNDGETGEHLGNDPRTFDAWYRLKPRLAKALSNKDSSFLDKFLDNTGTKP